MPYNLFLSCRNVFTNQQRPETEVLDIYYSPFPAGQWKVFQEQSDASNDITEGVDACDLCAWAVAYTTSNKTLREYSIDSFADFESGSPLLRQGEHMLAMGAHHVQL